MVPFYMYSCWKQHSYYSGCARKLCNLSPVLHCCVICLQFDPCNLTQCPPRSLSNVCLLSEKSSPASVSPLDSRKCISTCPRSMIDRRPTTVIPSYPERSCQDNPHAVPASIFICSWQDLLSCLY